MDVFALPAVIEIGGSGNEVFLQNIVTADVGALAAGQWLPTAFCTPQGKVVALIWLARAAEKFFLLLPSSQLAAVSARLQMLALNRKVVLNVRDDVVLSAAGGAERSVELQDRVLALGGIEGFSARHLLAAGIPWIEEAASGLFLPQMLNLAALGGLSYDKGCYLGQEAVARARRSAPVRRHLCRLDAKGEALPAYGATLFAAGSPAGFLLQSARTEAGVQALAVVQDRYRAAVLHTADGQEFGVSAFSEE